MEFMSTGPAMAREIEEVSEAFNETAAELETKVSENKRLDFEDQKTEALEALEKQKRIAESLESSTSVGEEMPPASTHIDNLIVFFNGDLDTRSKEQLRAVRNHAEHIYRKLQLLRPTSEGDLISGIYWISQRGLDQDIDLLFKAKRNPRFQSGQLQETIDFGLKLMIVNRWHSIATFFELGANELVSTIEKAVEKYETLTSNYLRMAFKADRPTRVLRALNEIKVALESRFEAERINAWFGTPLPLFEGKTARQALLEGDVFSLLHLIKRMDEGNHY